jgi:hypothetical protein
VKNFKQGGKHGKTIPYTFTPELLRAAELEHIEYLITGGAKIDKIMKMYKQHDKETIQKIFDRVAWFCWGYTDSIEEDYYIQGKRVTATFPRNSDEKTMTLIKEILSKSYVELHMNTGNQQS